MPPTLDLTNNPFSSIAAAPKPTAPPPSDSGGFLNWIKNNGSTIGSIGGGLLGAALAPETGGLSLAIPALLAGSGAVAGNVGSQVANNQDVGSYDSIKSDVGQAALGGLSEFGGQVAGKAIGKAGEYASSLLSSKGEGLALASTGITNGVAKTWGAANKEAMSDFITRTGQVGDNAEKIAATTENMGQAYNEIARQSGVKIPLSDVGSTLDQVISDQGKPVGSAGEQFVQRLKNERDTIMRNLVPDAEGNIDIGQLADAKSELYNVSRGNKITNPTGINDVEETLANSLMDKLNTVAKDNSLVTQDGSSLEQLGKDLRKQSSFNQLVQKNAYASANSAKPITTGGIVRAVGGGGAAGFMAGGPIGAAAGTIAEPLVEAAVNSPAALKVLSKGATSAAPIVGAAASKVAGAVGSPLGVAAQQAATMGALNSAANAAPSDPSMDLTAAGPSSVPSTPSLGGSDVSSGVAALQSGQPLTQSQYQALLEKDLTTTGGRFSSQITAAYQAGNPAAVQGLGVASGVVNSLQDLYNKAGGARGIIGGNIENAISPITKGAANSYNQQKLALGQEVVSQIYGSSGTSTDRDQILSLIPNFNDSPQVAASKMSTLRSLIQQRIAAMTSSTPGSVSAQAAGPSLNLSL